MKYKIALEVAEAEFIRLCEANRVEHDTEELNEVALESWNKIRAGIIRDLRIGTLIVGPDGVVTFTPPGSTKTLTFHSATGATLIALRSRKNETEGVCLALADMTRSDLGTFSKLHAQDFVSCHRLYTLFSLVR